jgi:ABC-type branched-subunit amino acid transport system ATPase component
MTFTETRTTTANQSPQANSKAKRSISWTALARRRATMTTADLAAEELRLIEEARAMAIAKGLDAVTIGDGWSRTPINEENTHANE